MQVAMQQIECTRPHEASMAFLRAREGGGFFLLCWTLEKL